MSNSNRDINAELRKAALEGNIEKVKSLISEGAKVNVKDQDNKTPLHFAAEMGHAGIVKDLLDKGASVNITDQNGKTPLHWAAKKGHQEAVKDLLDKGANVNATDHNGRAPFKLAANEEIRTLLENTAKLLEAAREGNIEEVTRLISEGANVNATGQDGKTPLHWAAEMGYKDAVKALLDKGANVNATDQNGNIPLGLAADEEIKTLLQSAEESDDASPVLQNDEEESQVSQNADLFEAIKGDNINEVKRLISEGADVNALDGNRFTPLRHAIAKGNKDMVSLLIDSKADVNAQSETGRALLHVAVDEANKTQPLATTRYKHNRSSIKSRRNQR